MLPSDADRDADVQPLSAPTPELKLPKIEFSDSPRPTEPLEELETALHWRSGTLPVSYSTPQPRSRRARRRAWQKQQWVEPQNPGSTEQQQRKRLAETQLWLHHTSWVGTTALATGLSFWGGVSLSAGSFAPPLSVAAVVSYEGVTQTLETLPVVASERWLQEMQRQETERLRHDFPVPGAFRGQVIREIRLPSNRKVIALTFDDGPSEPYSNDILYILNRYNVKATFFLLGQNVRAYPERVRQMHEQGHALGNHSWSHPYAPQSPQQAAAQIENTNTWIERAAGVKAKFFRPPGGYLHTGLADYVKNKGNTVVMWSADSKDYYASPARIRQYVLSQASPGGIVLLHDGGGDRRRTIAALPGIIEALQQQGYTFVTLPELMTLYEQETQAAATP